MNYRTSSIHASAIALLLASTPLRAETPKDAGAGLLGAVFGAIVNEVVGAPGAQQNSAQGGAVVPFNENASKVNERAEKFYRRAIEDNRSVNGQPATIEDACHFASIEIEGRTFLEKQCIAALSPMADDIKQQVLASKAERQRLAEERRKAEASEKTQKADADRSAKESIKVAYVASGDMEALKAGCYKVDDVSGCVDSAFFARAAELKAQRVQPRGCREYGFFHGYFMNGANPMAASLEPSKQPGLFQGEVQQIEGQRLAIFNRTTQQIAVVSVSRSQKFEGSRLAVGSQIVGYGVQTGTSQGKRATGAGTTISQIEASCVGPDA